MKSRAAGLAVLGVLASICGAWSVGCGEADQPSRSRGDGRVGGLTRPVPLPELSGLEDSVRADLRNAHASLLAEARRTRVPGPALGDRYGEVGRLFHAYVLLGPAEACYLNAQTLAPSDYRWPSYLAYVYASRGELNAAMTSLERSLSLKPGDLPSLVRLAQALLDVGRLEEAQRRFEQALGVDRQSAPALVGLGRVALQRKAYQEAVERFAQALALVPWASSIHYQLAMGYRGLGRTAEAQEHLRQRGEVQVSVPDPLLDAVSRTATVGKRIHRERGMLAASTGQWTEAVAELRQAVAADAADAAIRLNLGMALWMTGERAGAREQYHEAARLDPSDARAYQYLGMASALDGDDRRAIEHLLRAAGADRGSVGVWLGLGMALERSRRFAEAVGAYEKVLQLDPANARARLNRAFSLVALQRHDEARARLEEDLQVLPTQPAFAHALARLLAASLDPRVRDGRRAMQLAERVGRELPSADLVETAAMAAAELGQYRDAVRLQMAAIEAAEQAQRPDLVRRLREMLDRYQRGRPCRVPWPANDPVFSPPPLPMQFGEQDTSMR